MRVCLVEAASFAKDERRGCMLPAMCRPKAPTLSIGRSTKHLLWKYITDQTSPCSNYSRMVDNDAVSSRSIFSAAANGFFRFRCRIFSGKIVFQLTRPP